MIAVWRDNLWTALIPAGRGVPTRLRFLSKAEVDPDESRPNVRAKTQMRSSTNRLAMGPSSSSPEYAVSREPLLQMPGQVYMGGVAMIERCMASRGWFGSHQFTQGEQVGISE
ncbi:hypothetical protein MCOR21_003359 [Pyricularia oryzae]|uniref:Uncharacterized protein n=1 Tax=Pyricularia grisea TaxID=148305 RepID=A0ABQ8NHK6_PYRGI|nr:hypothetical protein MCOR19_004746 [Pyricularia oryzae]KAI6297195.1 hypothetical protein MCOR33_006396 [Pyricularia grisea]KAI6315172.1 hypothetical protein MCOR34_004751 [Pyricularia oryzae]KAI6322508.1 hypothetical protein MCOR30_007621 [Pyricularia oryzae]KAI6339214.1 hypothetical protein MCOR28_007448 [Pyricularia oryzae]